MTARLFDLRDTRGSIDKTLSVLEAVVDAAPHESLGAIAERCGLGKSNTHRILQTLVRRGYARTDGHGSYAPGSQILALAGAVLATLDYAAVARPALSALHARIGETIHFGVLSGGALFYVDKLEGRGAYRMASAIGMQLPVHSTAIGKAVLAELDGAERDELLGDGPLAARTANTYSRRTELDAELKRISEAGYAFDDEENEIGVRCVGAPVFGTLGKVVGGVSISLPAFLLDDTSAARLAPDVIDTTLAISRSLGAPPPVLARIGARAKRARLANPAEREKGRMS
jgi:IclR family acetate operon transcriptional repressor